jgi:hypothetical protein
MFKYTRINFSQNKFLGLENISKQELHNYNSNLVYKFNWKINV